MCPRMSRLSHPLARRQPPRSRSGGTEHLAELLVLSRCKNTKLIFIEPFGQAVQSLSETLIEPRS